MARFFDLKRLTYFTFTLKCNRRHCIYHINVYLEIAPIITKYGPASLFLKKGSTGYLNCTLSPLTSTATVKWTKDQVEINIANDPRFATNKFNDLIILNAQSGAQNSEGKYRCSATNSVNTTTNNYDLVVKVTGKSLLSK